MDPLVHTGIAGGVATLTLASPRNRNALSARMRADLVAALEAVTADESVRAVVLSHTGPVFCAGMDLTETAVEEPGREGVRELPRILQLVARCPKPVIARLAGPARAGGIGILAATDIVIAVPSATFAFSEVRIGLVPAVISVPVLDRMDSVAARELLLTGAVFDARRAREAGLVNLVVDPAGDDPQDAVQALDAAVAEQLGQLLRGGPTALAGTKALLRSTLDDSDERYAALLALSSAQFSSDEGREGARSFTEKRSAAWVLEEQAGP